MYVGLVKTTPCHIMFAQEEDDLHTPLLRQFGGQRVAESSGRPGADRRLTTRTQRQGRARQQRRQETLHESLDFDPIINFVTAQQQESVRPLRCGHLLLFQNLVASRGSTLWPILVNARTRRVLWWLHVKNGALLRLWVSPPKQAPHLRLHWHDGAQIPAVNRHRSLRRLHHLPPRVLDVSTTRSETVQAVPLPRGRP